MLMMMEMMLMLRMITVADLRKDGPAMLVIKWGSSGSINPRINAMYGVKETTLMFHF